MSRELSTTASKMSSEKTKNMNVSKKDTLFEEDRRHRESNQDRRKFYRPNRKLMIRGSIAALFIFAVLVAIAYFSK
jgi:hypothetical protein